MSWLRSQPERGFEQEALAGAFSRPKPLCAGERGHTMDRPGSGIAQSRIGRPAVATLADDALDGRRESVLALEHYQGSRSNRIALEQQVGDLRALHVALTMEASLSVATLRASEGTIADARELLRRLHDCGATR
jgi:hypothetical protein